MSGLFVITGNPLPEDIFRSDWILGLVILPLFLYAIVSSIEQFPAVRLTKRIFRYSLSSADFRNSSGGTPLYETLLGLIALISISTFLYFVELHFNLVIPGLKGPYMWLINLGFSIGAVIFRYIVSILTGYLTSAKEMFDEYFYIISRFYKFLAIPLVFVNFLIPYMISVPDIILIIIVLSLALLLYVLRYIRLLLLFIRRRFSLYYLILYLCALEITPVLILYKYLTGTV